MVFEFGVFGSGSVRFPSLVYGAIIMTLSLREVAMVVVILDDAGSRHYVKVVRLDCDNISSMDTPVANIILEELRQLYKHRITEQR